MVTTIEREITKKLLVPHIAQEEQMVEEMVADAEKTLPIVKETSIAEEREMTLMMTEEEVTVTREDKDLILTTLAVPANPIRKTETRIEVTEILKEEVLITVAVALPITTRVVKALADLVPEATID